MAWDRVNHRDNFGLFHLVGECNEECRGRYLDLKGMKRIVEKIA
jgi:hypothetical protein